jgi:hypothetical protein
VATGSARRRARGRPRGRVATSSCAPPPARSVQPKVKTKISSGAKGSADVPCLADSGDKAGGLVLMGCLSDNFSWTADLLATPHPPSRSAASISSSPPPPHSVPGSTANVAMSLPSAVDRTSRRDRWKTAPGTTRGGEVTRPSTVGISAPRPRPRALPRHPAPTKGMRSPPLANSIPLMRLSVRPRDSESDSDS